jgi:hypothetical protein
MLTPVSASDLHTLQHLTCLHALQRWYLPCEDFEDGEVVDAIFALKASAMRL